MATIPGLDSAIRGVQRGTTNLNKHASEIASAKTMEGKGETSLPESLVGLKESELQIKAALKVVETVDDVLGTLLDVKA